MSVGDFLLIWLSVLATMLVCRCVPIFALKGRQLSPRVSDAIGLIPVAAFAALVANDLIQPAAYAADPRSAIAPLLGAVIVCVVARKTKSLVWCALTGLVAYAAISFVVGAAL